MVLRLILAVLFLVQPMFLLGCDPNFQPQEIFTILLKPLLSPGVALLAANMAIAPGIAMPNTWESVSADQRSVDRDIVGFDPLGFRASCAIFGFMAGKLRDNLFGRAILNTAPVVFSISRDGLLAGGWQMLVLQLSIPVSGKVVIYQEDGKISFIDEIDSTLNFSLTSAWPPVLFRHLRVWSRNGLIFSWPGEGSELTEGVTSSR